MSDRGAREIVPPGPSDALRAMRESVEEMKYKLELKRLERAYSELDEREARLAGAGPQAQAPPAGEASVVAELIRSQTQLVSTVLGKMLDRSKAPDAELAALRAEIQDVRMLLQGLQEGGPRGGAGALSELVQLVTGLRDVLPELATLLRPAGGGGATEAEPLWASILRELAPQVLPQIMPQIMTRLRVPPEGSAAVVGVPAPAPGAPLPQSAPGPQPRAAPAAPSGAAPGAGGVDVELLRQGLRYLKGKAAAGSDPALYSSLILDGIAEPFWRPIARLAEGATLEQLADLCGDSELLEPPYRQWFAFLLDQVKRGLSEPLGEDDDGEEEDAEESQRS